MAPAARAAMTVMVAVAVLSLLCTSVTCTDDGSTQSAASDFVQNAKEKSATWAEWAHDKISEGLGFGQDDGEDAHPPAEHSMAEKSKIEFDSPLTADAFDVSADAGDAANAAKAAAGGASGRVTDAYEAAKARIDSFDRKKEEEIAASRP